MAKVVITGAKGFVGKHLTVELQQAGHHVVGWDLPELDIAKPATYQKQLADIQPDWVVHLAAISAVPAAEKNPALTHQVNVEGTKLLLETISKASPATKVLVVSSADIYNQPRNVYAQTKLEMEELIEKTYNDRCLRVRPFPHIGPGQGLGFVTADFASQIVAIEKKKQPPIIKVGNLETRRDFTDVRDVVNAYRLLIEKGQLGGVYEVASGQVYNIQEVLDKLLDLSKVEIAIEQDPARRRPESVPMPPGDTSKLQALGWQPQIPLDQSLKDILAWWREKTLRECPKTPYCASIVA